MKRLVIFALAFFVFALPTTGLAGKKQSDTCAEHFASGSAPIFLNQKLAVRAVPLCFEGFAVMHSGISRTPLWSAELLTPERIVLSKTVKRNNRFHAEARLPAADRAELRDYARSGYDRGHMSPAADMPTVRAQYESFSLANIVPQDPNHNQILWAAIEEATRALAQQRGTLYVITGPIFEGSSLQRLNARVLVPTHLFKAVYDPVGEVAAAYVSANKEGAEYHTTSILELEQRLGINLFPSMPPKTKEAKMRLPPPKMRARRGHEAKAAISD